MHINQREDRLLDSWDVARLAHPSTYNQPEKKLIARDRRPAALHLTSKYLFVLNFVCVVGLSLLSTLKHNSSTPAQARD